MSRANPPRPPVDADEATTLVAFLDHFRGTVRRQVAGLDTEQLQHRIEPSTMTLGGLVKHLAYVEHWWFHQVLAGGDEAEPWASADWSADEDWDWHSAGGQDVEELLALLDAETDRSDAVVAELLPHGLDHPAARRTHHGTVTLRWVLVHMVEEYARHCGHADLLREHVDGATNL